MTDTETENMILVFLEDIPGSRCIKLFAGFFYGKNQETPAKKTIVHCNLHRDFARVFLWQKSLAKSFMQRGPDQELPNLARLHLSGQGAYLRWEEDEEGQEYFWNKLTKHLNVNLKVNHMIPPN